MLDYYKILCIKRDARDEDIRKAYHNLALRYHPDKNKEAGAEQSFKQILEAYQVLSDKNRRYEYDSSIAIESLIQPKKSKKTISPWTNPYEEFNPTEKSLSAFMKLLSKMKSPTQRDYRFEMYRSTARHSQSQPQAKSHGQPQSKSQSVPSMQSTEPPLERDFYITLEELHTGVSRKVRFSRIAYGGTRREDKILEVNIRPGTKAGSRIIFPREGDRIPGTIPADLIFVVREMPHPFFKRCGNDLKYTARIPLHFALNGHFRVSVPTLEGRIIQLPILDEVTKPNTIKYIPHRGLAHFRNPKKRGNLLIVFKIDYPKTMSAKTRRMIAKSLFN